MIATTVSVLAFLPFISAVSYDVIVGGPGKLLYTPEYVNAQVGDSVRFWFQQKNHTATQSTFATPCAPLAAGFDSGFQPVPDTQVDGFPFYDVVVKDTNPVWFYCRQGTHCSAGMVFAINAPATGNTFAAFKANAQGAPAAAPPVGAPSASVSAPAYPYPSAYPPAYPSATSVVAPLPSAAAPVEHRVVVGGTGNIYTPNTITAKKGDTVLFEFRQKNHTVTQSSFDNPCRKLEFTSTTGETGFDSGFQPVAPEVTTGFPTWSYTVTDETKPIWAYCRQTGHCGQGMVLAINAPATGKTFAAFQDNAKKLNGTAPATPGASGSASSAPSSATQTPNSALAAIRGDAVLASLAVVAAVAQFGGLW